MFQNFAIFETLFHKILLRLFLTGHVSLYGLRKVIVKWAGP